jgi:Na+/proline symporter
VFALALGFPRANGHGAFIGLLAGMATVAVVAFHPSTRTISFLWHNPIGVIAVCVVGLLVTALTGGRKVVQP